MSIDLRLGDCFEAMQSMPDNSIDLVLTDPPYGLKFMGKKWDYDVPPTHVWYECLRVLKPGGHVIAFSGSRTYHRMACRIEDAGFEIRDMLAWLYGSGFPKSKTQLKPAIEPMVMARKALDGTIKTNFERYGVGQLNIDECKVGDEPRSNPSAGNVGGGNSLNMSAVGMPRGVPAKDTVGRWPANLIHDGSDDVADVLGHASGYFYCAKASKKERDAGCGDMPLVNCGMMEDDNYPIKTGDGNLRDTKRRNHHPTVKPIALMEYLVKLASSEGQTILDPFMGSGTTGIACQNLNRNFIGIEMDEEYFEIAKNRINNAVMETLF